MKTKEEKNKMSIFCYKGERSLTLIFKLFDSVVNSPLNASTPWQTK